jgi:hypothetical protein
LKTEQGHYFDPRAPFAACILRLCDGFSASIVPLSVSSAGRSRISTFFWPICYTNFCENIMFYAREDEKGEGERQHRLLNELYDMGRARLPSETIYIDRHVGKPRTTFHALAVIYNLQFFVRETLDGANGATIRQKTPLLYFALIPSSSYEHLEQKDFPEPKMVLLLLSKGLEPDQELEDGFTVRQAFESTKKVILSVAPREQRERLLLTADLLQQHGIESHASTAVTPKELASSISLNRQRHPVRDEPHRPIRPPLPAHSSATLRTDCPVDDLQQAAGGPISTGAIPTIRITTITPDTETSESGFVLGPIIAGWSPITP